LKKIILAVTNDLSYDQRVLRVISTLKKSGNQLIFIGRRTKSSSLIKHEDFESVRFRLIFNKKFLFYAEFNIRLFIYLLFRKSDLLVANDLDTLPAMYLISRFKRIPLIYDSHEFFTGVPEIQDRKFVRLFWENIEKCIFPKLKYVMTVNDSIAGLYDDKYGIRPYVVRNFAHYRAPYEFIEELPFDLQKRKFFILQGTGINLHRGGEEAVHAMKFIEEAHLVIVGKGRAIVKIKELITNHGVEDRVILIDTMSYEDLNRITSYALAGLSLDKPASLNYLYSLPNKLSDYIQARVPVIVSNMPEVAALVSKYNVGMVCNEVTPEEIARCMRSMLGNQQKYNIFKGNLEKAATDVCWENEENKLIDLYTHAGISFKNF
jgi:glycosyltransferase involved in cell wall biosynthesis